MRFAISFFLCTSALASPINVFHEGNVHEANMYKAILEREYKIPEELVTVRLIKTCDGLKAVGKLDLCLKNNGDLLMVSVDREFVDESLKVFKAP